MAVYWTRRSAGRVAVIAGISTAGAVAATVFSGTANAADLSCTAQHATESVSVDGSAACGARSDETSRAFARALDAVAFARADVAGSAIGVANDGAVAAAETASGIVGALAFGHNAVSIVSPDPGAAAVAVSLPRGQTFVGTATEGVRCDAGAGMAVNFTTGQVCLSDGATTWSSGLVTR